MAAGIVEDISFDVVAVLPAAGSGVRMNLEVPKQFCSVLGRPLISLTMDAFERVTWIKEIIVPIQDTDMPIARQILKEFSHRRVRLVSGGLTRHRSIWKGIQALTDNGQNAPDVVILHDAVRPFADEEMLRRVTLAAKQYGAAGSIRPLVSTTIAQSSDGFLDHSLDRSKLRASEMPQAFCYHVIHNAYKQCSEDDFEHGTECLHLAQKYSKTRALLIDGPDCLWKVTYKKDLHAVEGVLRDKQNLAVVLLGAEIEGFVDNLCKELQKRQKHVTYLRSVKMDQQLSESFAKRLAGEVKEKLRNSCGGCLSVVHIADHISGNNKTCNEGCPGMNPSLQPTSLRVFLQTLFHSFKSCIFEGVVIHITISNKRQDFFPLKENTQQFGSWAKEQYLRCFGVWVCPHLDGPQEGKDVISRHLEKAVELTVGAMLDVPAVLNGQVFDSIT